MAFFSRRRAAYAVLAFLAAVSFLAVASRPPAQAALDFDAAILHAGVAEKDGNASIAFLVVNVTRPVHLDVSVLEKPVPRQVLLWDASDQAGFETFADALQARLGNESIPVSRTHTVPDAQTPAILIVASSAMPQTLLQDGGLEKFMEKGGVVLYAGLPLSVMASDGRIVPNPQWPRLQKALGMESRGSPGANAWSETTSSSRESEPRFQTFQHESGFFVAFESPLDRAFADGSQAAAVFSARVEKAAWQVPQTTFSANNTGLATFFSPAFEGNAVEMRVAMDGPGQRRIENVRLASPPFKLMAQFRIPKGTRFVASALANLSTGQRVRLSILKDATAWAADDWGVWPSGVSWQAHTVEANLTPGKYVLDLAAQGQHAYAALDVFAYRLEATHADAGTKTGYGRAWAGDVPVADANLSIGNKTTRTDAQGEFRFQDAAMHQGINELDAQIQGQTVTLQYAVPAGFLSSWPDRLLALAGLGTFGIAWMLQKRPGRTIRIRPAPPCTKLRIELDAPSLESVFSAVNKKFGWSKKPLDASEFASGLTARLGDPRIAVTPAAASGFLEQAHAAGCLHHHGNLAAPVSWFASDAAFLEGTLERRVEDILLANGWRARKDRNGWTCRKSGRTRHVALDARKGRVRLDHGKNTLGLDEFEARMRSESSRWGGR